MASCAQLAQDQKRALLADGASHSKSYDRARLANGASTVKSEQSGQPENKRILSRTVEHPEQNRPQKKKRPSTPYKKGARVGKQTHEARMKKLEKKFQERLAAVSDARSQSSSVLALEKDLIRLDDRLQEERKARAKLETDMAEMAKLHEDTTRKLIDENAQLKAQLEEVSST